MSASATSTLPSGSQPACCSPARPTPRLTPVSSREHTWPSSLGSGDGHVSSDGHHGSRQHTPLSLGPRPASPQSGPVPRPASAAGPQPTPAPRALLADRPTPAPRTKALSPAALSLTPPAAVSLPASSPAPRPLERSSHAARPNSLVAGGSS
ncbi:mucin-1-like isoform X1 [Micropterus dolomieu]|uniref:mucin-1-like isoform X1 n=1 Tax=Micropterus dolomieu TaxID=147949 RepID=UPI001E8DB347|nr:mucin-1-like isoform X1 [Micropterus dolomieu]